MVNEKNLYNSLVGAFGDPANIVKNRKVGTGKSVKKKIHFYIDKLTANHYMPLKIPNSLSRQYMQNLPRCSALGLLVAHCLGCF